MKVILLLCAIVYATNAGGTLTVGEYIDHMDPSAIMDNEATRNKVFECFMDRSPCGEFETMKEIVLKIIKSNCSECTQPQKEKFGKAMESFKTKHYDMYKAVMDKYT